MTASSLGRLRVLAAAVLCTVLVGCSDPESDKDQADAALCVQDMTPWLNDVRLAVEGEEDFAASYDDLTATGQEMLESIDDGDLSGELGDLLDQLADFQVALETGPQDPQSLAAARVPVLGVATNVARRCAALSTAAD